MCELADAFWWIGGVAGVVTILYAWYLPADTGDDKVPSGSERPNIRLSAILWPIAGGGAILVADLEKLIGNSDACGKDIKAQVFTQYATGFGFSLAATLGAILLLILFSQLLFWWGWIQRWPFRNPFYQVLVFLFGGFNRFRKDLRAEFDQVSQDAKALTERLEEQILALAAVPGIVAKHARMSARVSKLAFQAIVLEPKNVAGAKRGEARMELMKACAFLASHHLGSMAHGGRFRANYMRAEPHDATRHPVNKLSFHFGPVRGTTLSYSHVLEIVSRFDPQPAAAAPGALSLPVAGKSMANWQDYILPGAPAAFGTEQMEIWPGGTVGSQVPSSVLDEMGKRLQTTDVLFFLSLPVRKPDGTCCGVLNVDTDQPLRANQSFTTPLGRLIDDIQPHLVLLGGLETEF